MHSAESSLLLSPWMRIRPVDSNRLFECDSPRLLQIERSMARTSGLKTSDGSDSSAPFGPRQSSRQLGRCYSCPERPVPFPHAYRMSPLDWTILGCYCTLIVGLALHFQKR